MTHWCAAEIKQNSGLLLSTTTTATTATHRGGLTAGDQDGRVEALGQIKHQQILPVLQLSPAADVSLELEDEAHQDHQDHQNHQGHTHVGVGGVDDFGDVALLDGKEGDHSPSSKEGEEEEEAEDVRAGPLGDRALWTAFVGLPVILLVVPLT